MKTHSWAQRHHGPDGKWRSDDNRTRCRNQMVQDFAQPEVELCSYLEQLQHRVHSNQTLKIHNRKVNWTAVTVTKTTVTIQSHCSSMSTPVNCSPNDEKGGFCFICDVEIVQFYQLDDLLDANIHAVPNGDLCNFTVHPQYTNCYSSAPGIESELYWLLGGNGRSH